MPQHELMTTAEVAEVFRCTPRTLWNWRSAGRLTPIKAGRRWLYKREDIRRLCGYTPAAPINEISDLDSPHHNGA